MSRARKMIPLDPMGQRRANGSRRLRESILRCSVAAYVQSRAGDRSLVKYLVEADFDPHRLLVRIASYGDNSPFPAWRLALLRMIRNAPWATLAELTTPSNTKEKAP